ncbi:hypothetical protein PLICRDRAFT_32805 [Plicaturopsis crispa FD-325 SS-3]|uniref:Uncharacterized protein n=1 Tax=Plicaturopsis crispa FD-325 SS-3 TaxID=944288 RepID=A0A0C9SQC5_PLICR|nr:hypothetical protein PLICRDRAFT_32805 [Plicaturopsis crispa FD-325 SS-3]
MASCARKPLTHPAHGHGGATARRTNSPGRVEQTPPGASNKLPRAHPANYRTHTTSNRQDQILGVLATQPPARERPNFRHGTYASHRKPSRKAPIPPASLQSLSQASNTCLPLGGRLRQEGVMTASAHAPREDGVEPCSEGITTARVFVGLALREQRGTEGGGIALREVYRAEGGSVELREAASRWVHNVHVRWKANLWGVLDAGVLPRTRIIGLRALSVVVVCVAAHKDRPALRESRPALREDRLVLSTVTINYHLIV